MSIFSCCNYALPKSKMNMFGRIRPCWRWAARVRQLCCAAEIDHYAPLPQFPPRPHLRPMLPYNCSELEIYDPPIQLMNAPFLSEVEFKLKEGIVVSYLRPKDEMSSFTWTMCRRLTTVLKDAYDCDDVKAIVIRGNDSNIFCAGTTSDLLLNKSAELDDDPAKAALIGCALLKDLLVSLISFPKPIIVAVGGSCSGLFFKMLPLFDAVIVSEKVKLSDVGDELAGVQVACSSCTVLSLSVLSKSDFGNRCDLQFGFIKRVPPGDLQREARKEATDLATKSSSYRAQCQDQLLSLLDKEMCDLKKHLLAKVSPASDSV